MEEPTIRAVKDGDGPVTIYCDRTQSYVVEYCFWHSRRPMGLEDVWWSARKYIPTLPRASMATLLSHLATRKKVIVRLKHGVYIHKDVEVLYSLST